MPNLPINAGLVMLECTMLRSVSSTCYSSVFEINALPITPRHLRCCRGANYSLYMIRSILSLT